ncbi:hypothetical protein DRJ48_04780 [Candidatus Woesearchaeota archaeon]|nr:MAG: hypothetical protein DRJ48_04780 [Candidatus Woesearchaeota archaeon]
MVNPYSEPGCFIATAAYGSEYAPQLNTLREFRDKVLLPSKIGAWFVKAYYRVSPPIAKFVAKSRVLRFIVRNTIVKPCYFLARKLV